MDDVIDVERLLLVCVDMLAENACVMVVLWLCCWVVNVVVMIACYVGMFIC